MLVQRLREMEKEGIITRTDLSGKIKRVEYTVCDPFGIAVLDLLVFLADWGRRNLSVSNVNDVIAPPPIARAVAIGASVQRLISD